MKRKAGTPEKPVLSTEVRLSCSACGALMYRITTGCLDVQPSEVLQTHYYTEEWHCPNEPHRLSRDLGELPKTRVNTLVRWAKELSLDAATIRRILRGS